MSGIEIDRGTRGRALFTALGYGWAWFGALGFLGSSFTLLTSLAGLFEFAHSERPSIHDQDPWIVYGFEMGLTGVLVQGATLACAILFLCRFALFRGFLEVCLWLQAAMLIWIDALYIQYLLRLHWEGVGDGTDAVIAYFGTIWTVVQMSGGVLLAILSLIYIRDAGLIAETDRRSVRVPSS